MRRGWKMSSDKSDAGIIAGTKIRRARLKAGMTRAEVSEALQIDETTVRVWEHFGFCSKLLDKIIDLHITLDVPLWSLLPTEEELGLKKMEDKR